MNNYINYLKVENFRNIENVNLKFDNKTNIIYGDNAQGKTNIIEAIYFFALGKSFRGAKDVEMIRFGNQKFNITLNYKDSIRDNNISYTSYSSEIKRKKEIILNDIKLKSNKEMIGNFHSVLFCPEHLSIVKEDPSKRRTFLDNAICQLKPAYVNALYEYEKILVQRNALIKNYEEYEREKFDSLIEILNQKFSANAAYITSVRYKYLKKLFDYTNSYMRDMTNEKENVSYIYLNSLKEDVDYLNLEELKNKYFNLLSEKVDKEIYNGTTLFGPHRDDVDILLNEKEAKIYASQGQQRSIALAMKLSEGELSKEYTGEYPIFLLDDVLSELDRKRKEYILSGFENRQTIITTCEKEDFRENKNALKIETINGTYSSSYEM